MSTTLTGSGATARVRAALAAIEASGRPEIWITVRAADEVLAEAAAVDEAVAAGTDLPLAGLLLAVKNNVDVAGIATTAACPGFAYPPERDAAAVARLRAAGAVVVGATNLDQFATGLVGTRSPHGAVRDARRPDRISGGSSSGSAVAVALGLADIAIGTDTAGSGRVPAGLQGIVGIKATLNVVSTAGVVPACRSWDAVTIFARDLDTAELAMGTMAGGARPWPADVRLAAPARPRVAYPASLPELPQAWADEFGRQIARLQASGVDAEPIEFDVFLQASRLLYDGGLVAERYAAVGAFVDAAGDSPDNPAGLDPTVAGIVRRAGQVPAHRYVADTARLDGLKRQAMARLKGFDALVVPTAPFHPSLADVAADPVGVNSRMGTYTNFCNLFDLCAVAVPAGEMDGSQFGLTVVGRTFDDAVAADIARRIETPPLSPALFADGAAPARQLPARRRGLGTAGRGGGAPQGPAAGPPARNPGSLLGRAGAHSGPLPHGLSGYPAAETRGVPLGGRGGTGGRALAALGSGAGALPGGPARTDAARIRAPERRLQRRRFRLRRGRRLKRFGHHPVWGLVGCAGCSPGRAGRPRAGRSGGEGNWTGRAWTEHASAGGFWRGRSPPGAARHSWRRAPDRVYPRTALG